MKTRIVLAAALAAATVGAGADVARADLTYQGAVGLPLNPTAQIPEPGGIRLQGNYYDFGSANGTLSSVDSNLLGLAAAGRVGEFEISGGIQNTRNRTSVLGSSNSDNEVGFSLGGKYLFTRETDPAGVRIAAGLGYADFDAFAGNGRNIHAYLVASKYLGEVTGERVPITGHAGIRYDRFTFGDSANRARTSKGSLFAGAEVPITARGDVAFVGELQTKNVSGGSTPYSASVRYRPQGQPFGASIGVQRQGLGDSGLFLQIGYTFGGGAAASPDLE